MCEHDERLRRLLDEREIGVLMLEFAHRLDHLSGLTVHELFLEDGVYAIDEHVLTGRAKIRDGYVRRAARGPRTSRHLFTAPRFEEVTAQRARAVSGMVLYAADGTPALDASSPLMVADVHDEVVKTSDGWRFASRRLTSVFREAGAIVPPSNPARSEGNS